MSISEEQDLILEKTQRRMCAMPGEKCGYCGKLMPENAIGNPMWPYRRLFARGVIMFCSEECKSWQIFTQQKKSVIARGVNSGKSNQ